MCKPAQASPDEDVAIGCHLGARVHIAHDHDVLMAIELLPGAQAASVDEEGEGVVVSLGGHGFVDYAAVQPNMGAGNAQGERGLQLIEQHRPALVLLDIGLLYIPVAVILITGSANAVNLTDGLDGLAGLISATAFVAYGIIAFLQDQTTGTA